MKAVDLLRGIECPEWLRDLFDARVDSPLVLDRAEAIGLVGRYYGVEGMSSVVDNACTLARHLSPALRLAIGRAANEEYDTLLVTLSEAGRRHRRAKHHDYPLILYCCDQRDRLESVAFVLRRSVHDHGGISTDFLQRLQLLDEFVAERRFDKPLGEHFAESSRLCAARKVNPSAWWGCSGA